MAADVFALFLIDDKAVVRAHLFIDRVEDGGVLLVFVGLIRSDLIDRVIDIAPPCTGDAVVLNGFGLGSRGWLTGGFGNHISLCSGIRFEFHRGGYSDGLGLHCENMVGKSGNRLGQLCHVGGCAVDVLSHGGL